MNGPSSATQEQVSAQPAFTRKRRIVLSLVAVLVLVGLAPLSLVAWKLIDINREALTTAQQEYQLLVASSLAHEVDIHVESLSSQLLRVAQTLGAAIRRQGGVPRQEIRRALNDVANERLLYLRYSFFRGSHVESVASGDLPERLEPVVTEGLERVLEKLNQDAQVGVGRAFVSNPRLLEGDPRRATMVVSAPVISGGRFRGVLSALVDLQAVWDSITQRNRTGHMIYAADRSGRVFASTDPVLIAPGSDASSSEIVQRFLGAVGLARETMPFQEERDGVEVGYLGSYQVTPERWGIFVQAPLRDVYHPVRSMIESTLTWALAALSLAILAAVFFARTLSNPINHLAAASRAFAKGEFSTRVSVRSRNEIGELADTFNRMAANIEEHIRRVKRAARENNELFMGTIRALAQAIDAKDPYTRGHSVRVNRYSVLIARQMRLSEKDIRDIHVSSLLHDVGKIGINDVILNKPGKLTHDEFEIMKTHPVLGANIMSQIRQMKPIIPGLRWHHERWHGEGYPDGLSGEDIPLMARIIAVADVFDAMTTHRPYQDTMTFEQAHARINVLKGVALDERVVEAFNRIYAQGLIQPDPEGTAHDPFRLSTERQPPAGAAAG